MKLKYLLAAVGLVAAGGYAFSQGGLNQGFPIAGKAAYCSSTQNGVCVNTVPAGPTSLTGQETFLADTQLSGGQNYQTVAIPIGLATLNSQGAFRNALIAADFGQNLWSRGATFTTLTPTTAAYTADRWYTYSSGNTVTITRQIGSTDVPNNNVSGGNGLLASMRVNRPSGTDVTNICVGQVLPAKDAARLLGNNVVFSWFGLNGSTMSAAGGSVKAYIAYGTAADSATPNTNTDAFAKATLTGYTNVVTTVSGGTIASAIGTVPQSTSWTRYWATGTIPTTATTVGIQLCYTPVGTGTSTDWFEFAGAQLEAAGSGIVVPGSFSRRTLAYETLLQQSFSYVLTDTAITTTYGWCQEKVANTSANCTLQFPTTMRMIPSTVVSATGWSIQQTDATNELCSALAGVASSNTILEGRLLCTAPGTIALGTMSPFLGGATTSTITFSAEP